MKQSTKNVIVREFVERISGRILEDYRRIIAEMIKGHAGVYALYKNDRLYYVGLANNLMGRVNHHLKDRHQGKWDRFSVYLTTESYYIRPLEALVLRIVDVDGNRVKGRLAGARDLIRPLARQITEFERDKTAGLLGTQAIRRRRLRKTRDTRGSLPLKGLLDRRLSLKGWYKGKEYSASLRRDGQIQYQRKLYDSPTAPARKIFRRSVNGWLFWHYKAGPKNWVPLADLKR